MRIFTCALLGALCAVTALPQSRRDRERDDRIDRGSVRENRNLRVPERGDRYEVRREDGDRIGRLNRNRQDTQSIANPNSSAGRRWERMPDHQKKNARIYEEDTFGSERKNRRKP